MCGNATLAIAVSSNSMNVAMVTVMAMIHGLIASRGAGRLKAAAVGVSVSLMGYSCLDADATVRSHTTMQGCHKRLLGRKPRKQRQVKGLVRGVGDNWTPSVDRGDRLPFRRSQAYLGPRIPGTRPFL